jgi:hypothetical protein
LPSRASTSCPTTSSLRFWLSPRMRRQCSHTWANALTASGGWTLEMTPRAQRSLPWCQVSLITVLVPTCVGSTAFQLQSLPQRRRKELCAEGF